MEPGAGRIPLSRDRLVSGDAGWSAGQLDPAGMAEVQGVLAFGQVMLLPSPMLKTVSVRWAWRDTEIPATASETGPISVLPSDQSQSG